MSPLDGVPALGIPGATTWRGGWASHLDGIPVIYVVVEHDRGGEAVQKWVAESDIRDRVRLIHPPDTFKSAWQATLDAAARWSDRARAASDEEEQKAWRRCAALAQSRRILSPFATAAKRFGVVGERRAVQLAYLIVTSRLSAAVVRLLAWRARGARALLGADLLLGVLGTDEGLTNCALDSVTAQHVQRGEAAR